MNRYNTKEFQKKWQKRWNSDKTFVANLRKSAKPSLDRRSQDCADKPKFYNLMMFPYPSGEGLHVGHVYAFGGADTFGHFKKMQGHNVFEPMGFDSFGIHSENYAIKVKKHPQKLIEERTKYFKEEQLQKLGALFDWEHSVTTSDIHYYRWTQWLFVQLFKSGLAVRKKAAVDWCPSCQTVLADEQVIAGKCERCNSDVVQKELEQWFFKITTYAQKLLDNLDKIDWSETTKTMQRNWIGRSEGAVIKFAVSSSQFAGLELEVYTTRPDTVYGATFMVVAPEYPQIDQLITKDNKEKVSDYINKAKNKSEVERSTEKTGMFTGSYAVNPFTKQEIPIWVADYVLMGYGTGAIMAVPAHDQRDFEFAKKYDLPIVEVVSGGTVEKEAWVGEGNLVNSSQFTGKNKQEAIEAITSFLEKEKLGQRKVNFHLRDWLISRQRYWGPPIPMIFCENCAQREKSWFSTKEAELRIKDSQTRKSHAKSMAGWYPVAEENLPVELPFVENYQPKGTGISPLASVAGFVKVNCPGCGQEATRETDVSDTFLDSSWYFLRYPSVGEKSSTVKLGGKEIELPWDSAIDKQWLPVDSYIGGNEHAVLHLLYTRFITMALNDMGLLDFEEPFKKFRAHGLIIYKGAKMSKSRGNVVDPNEYMDAYGSDTLKMYLLFIGPYELGGEFDDRAIIGVYKFLNRVWTLVQEVKDQNNTSASQSLLKKLAQTNVKVSSDLENLRFNTAIASLMELLNVMIPSKENISNEVIKHYLLLLAPFAPFTAEELWERLGENVSIHQQSWPEANKDYLKEDKDVIVIQVNGRFRDKVAVNKGIDKESVASLALDRQKVKIYTQGKVMKNVVWVEGKLLNFVVS